MIANFFKQSKPIVFILLGGVLSLVYFLEVSLKQNPLLRWDSLGLLVFNYSLLLGVFILFELSIKHFEIQKGHSYVSLFFVLLSIFLIPDIIVKTEFYAFVILSLALSRLLNLCYAVKIETSIFESVFLICIAGFFYKPVLVFLILVFITTVIFTNSHWRYFIIPVLAISASVVLTQMYYLYVYESLAGIDDLLPAIRRGFDLFDTPLSIFITVFWIIAALVSIYQIYSVKLIRSLYHRQMASLFLAFIFLALGSCAFQSSSLSGLWLMSLWPFCIYLGDFISRLKKKLWQRVTFWSFVIIPISIYIIRTSAFLI